MGAGTIGLVNLLVAKSMGAAKIIIVDINEDRLSKAKQMGAYKALNIKISNPKERAKFIKQQFDGCEPDVTIECTGVESCIQTSIYATKTGGCVVIVGMGKDDINFPIIDLCCREIDLRGIFRYCNTYPTAINMLSSGAVKVDGLVTHRVSLANAQEGFEMTRDGKGIKTMIDCSAEGNCKILK